MTMTITDKTVKTLITDKLHEIYIFPHLNGYFYLTDALEYIIEETSEDKIIPSMQSIYHHLGDKASYTKIERNIRYALEYAAKQEDFTKRLKNVLGYDLVLGNLKTPQIKPFIAAIAKKIKTELKGA